jgi:hypothetical protein
MKKTLLMFLIASSLVAYGTAEAVQTKLVIRAKSKDAKFVGTKMGGARVVVRDSETGKVLAEGLTSGGTGDTRKIMLEPKTRFGSIARGAAAFEASIDIDEPRLLTIEVEAPLIYKDNMIKSSTQIWAIPGRDITGDGIVVEIPGFAIDARAPETVNLTGGRAVIPIEASIVMI